MTTKRELIIVALLTLLLVAVVSAALLDRPLRATFVGTATGTQTLSFSGSGHSSVLGKIDAVGSITDSGVGTCRPASGSVTLLSTGGRVSINLNVERCETADGEQLTGTYEAVRQANLNHYLNGRFYGSHGTGSFEATVSNGAIDARLEGRLLKSQP